MMVKFYFLILFFIEILRGGKSKNDSVVTEPFLNEF
jgi:hypothetical protein